MDRRGSELRWSVEQRLDFIDVRLFWEGSGNKSDLMGKLGVSVNQAFNDSTRYIRFAPVNIPYDKSALSNVHGSEIQPQFLEPNASRYLTEVRPVAGRLLDREDSWNAADPTYACAPTPVCGINSPIRQSTIGAIRRSEAIEAGKDVPQDDVGFDLPDPDAEEAV